MDSQFKHWFLDQDGQEWRDLHQKQNSNLFTASIVPTLVGFGYSNQSRNKLRSSYIGTALPETTTSFLDGILQWGKDHEKDALHSFFSKNPCFLGVKPGLLLSRDNEPAIGASLDSIMLNTHTNELWGLETKCPWSDYVPLTTAELPGKAKWLIQMQVQMHCAELNWEVLWIWTPSASHGFVVPRDQRIIDIVVAEVKQFHFRHIVKGLPVQRGKPACHAQLIPLLEDMCERCLPLCVHGHPTSL